MTHEQFISEIWKYYHQHGRNLPWRQREPNGSFDAYKILVSEMMLQQTQVTRVIDKYAEFLRRFPTLQRLAEASLAGVLVSWSGLGYNRRAKFLWQTAQQLVGQPQPWSYDSLVACPGIGPNTAAAIVVYAYNLPMTFVETNIRTVYIHHYYNDVVGVTDHAILALLEKTYDRENPREFFWALMDYGSHLKTTVGNLSRQSKQYAKQPKSEGSVRQLRGQILRSLASSSKTERQLAKVLPDDRLSTVLHDLIQEELIEKYRGTHRLHTSTKLMLK